MASRRLTIPNFRTALLKLERYPNAFNALPLAQRQHRDKPSRRNDWNIVVAAQLEEVAVTRNDVVSGPSHCCFQNTVIGRIGRDGIYRYVRRDHHSVFLKGSDE